MRARERSEGAREGSEGVEQGSGARERMREGPTSTSGARGAQHRCVWLGGEHVGLWKQAAYPYVAATLNVTDAGRDTVEVLCVFPYVAPHPHMMSPVPLCVCVCVCVCVHA